MNCIGGNTPSSGWVQRSSASTPVICPVAISHLRLIVQRELIAFEGAAQGGFQRQALDRLGLDLLGEEAETVLAVFLGEVHRHVGILGQRLHVATIRRVHGDADAGRGVALVAAQLQGLAEHRQQVAGDAFDVIALGDLLQNDDEFVAAEPRHDVARAQGAAQPAGDFHQQHVAGVVAQRIVDHLEPVEIDEQHRESPLMAAAPSRSRGEAAR